MYKSLPATYYILLSYPSGLVRFYQSSYVAYFLMTSEGFLMGVGTQV